MCEYFCFLELEGIQGLISVATKRGPARYSGTDFEKYQLSIDLPGKITLKAKNSVSLSLGFALTVLRTMLILLSALGSLPPLGTIVCDM